MLENEENFSSELRSFLEEEAGEPEKILSIFEEAEKKERAGNLPIVFLSDYSQSDFNGAKNQLGLAKLASPEDEEKKGVFSPDDLPDLEPGEIEVLEKLPRGMFPLVDREVLEVAMKFIVNKTRFKKGKWGSYSLEMTTPAGILEGRLDQIFERAKSQSERIFKVPAARNEDPFIQHHYDADIAKEVIKEEFSRLKRENRKVLKKYGLNEQFNAGYKEQMEIDWSEQGWRSSAGRWRWHEHS